MNFTDDIERFIARCKDRLSTQQIYSLCAVLIAGLLAHGYIIFNRISYHDNAACLFNLGGTYESGRWMLGIIYDLQMMTTKLFAVPVFNGILSIVFVGIAAMLLVDLFKVNSKFIAAAIGAVMVVYPVVTSIFSFMFTSWEYHLALLLSVLAAKIFIENKTVGSFILSVIVSAVGLGLYQAFFAVTIVMFLVALLLSSIDDEFDSVLAYVKTGILYLVNLGCGMVLWAVIRKLTMALKHIEVVEYKGMNEGYSIAKFPALIVDSIKAFVGFGQAGINAVLYQRAFTAIIVVVTILQIIYLISCMKSNIGLKLISIVGVILLPIGMNLVYLLSTSSEYHVDTLMVYGDIFVYILPLLLIEKMQANCKSNTKMSGVVSAVTWVQIISLFVMTFGYIYMDNAAYMKAEIAEEQATSYFNQLITAIKTCDGFSEDMDIILVGWDKLDDGTFVDVDNNEQLEAVKLEKFPRYTDIVRYGGSIYFIREHIGFGNEHVIEDDGTVAKESVVKKMPTYPNDGSIVVSDGRVIVKLGE
ncbi:glucosyltransferase domain-containing protein [Pseudobutyrivibrio ruminis]|uniref:glucosyltransferase domain-containing protein n=1 Tax=Pseudobutyrivibrio ruminis TaxID=46206 RepID=UPI0003FBA84A|nr:glucosyltransferase domain-containing protein [Pseudobutyrivibrio ruminis]